MAVSMENSTSACLEMDIGSSTESFQRFLESQKELFHSQIDQLERIVATQCKLTGVNPLSQEMAAGALSIKIGKRPRDLLNPKAVKYMQSVFSVKDTISKKECREISALCGVTVTQVREFFAGQRSRVRKVVRLSKEKVVRPNTCKASQDGYSTQSDAAMPINQVPLNSVDLKTVDEVPVCLSQEETIPGIDNSDRNFLENIFNLMRKEETFSGQVKLMEWILQIENSSVLYWFLTKGGLMILATWLSEAALEEQTTSLLVIFKVLCHLPLHRALPEHMSTILQTVNKLRFYRTSDISNRARVLLARWSKLFVRNQVLKKPASVKSPNDAQEEIIHKQRNSDELKSDIPEILALTFEGSENCRKSEHQRTPKLLPQSTDDLNRKHVRSVSSHQTRERRKVLLMEQPGQKTGGRSPQVARAVPALQGRPMSADDIQKAKTRALYMQSKYGKTGSSSSESHQRKTEDQIKSSASQISHLLSASKTIVSPLVEEDTKSAVLASETSPSPSEAPIDSNPSLDHQEFLWEKFKRDQVSWQMPPEIRINSLWKIGAGEKSKEVEVQIERIRREKETFYHNNLEIPPNPKDPWDLEIDYDDTLTPEIPTEQPPDADVPESLASPFNSENTAAMAAIESTAATAISKGIPPEPDVELLAVLLKNPELVFALTSGQGSSLTSAETVRLLDMIKASEIGLPGVVNGLGGKADEVQATSLPSPTPSERIMSGWKSEVGKDAFRQPVSAASRDAAAFPAVTSTTPLLEQHPNTGLVQPQIPTANFTSPQLPTIATPLSQVVLQLHPAPQIPAAVPVVTPSLNHDRSTIFPSQQPSVTEVALPMKHIPLASPPLQNFPIPAPTPPRPDISGSRLVPNFKPATVSIVLNPPKERSPYVLPPMPALLPTQLGPQQPLLPEPLHFPALYPSRLLNSSGSQATVSDSWNVGQVSATNTHFESNQNNYNVHPGSFVQPQLFPGPRENEFVNEPELEMWSPERSPEWPPEYRSGWNLPEPRRGYSRNPKPDRSRQHNPVYRERRHGSRRWRDRRH